MILFSSTRPLERAENIKAVWDAWEGEKDFVRLDGTRDNDQLADSKYNILVTDEFVTKAPEICIMIGHGAAGGKTFGLDQPDPYHTLADARLITWATTSGRMTSQMTAKYCGIPISKVLPFGMPRTDAYFGAERRETGKRIYLYCPTFRKFYEGDEPLETTDFEKLDGLLNDNELLIVKPHMVMDEPPMDYRHIVMASKNETSTQYLVDCDVLITDYSSIMFDAYILGRPVVLFAKDKSDYLWNRGMYFRYPDAYSGRFCDNEYDLVRLCRQAYAPTDQEILTRHIACDMCDGHSTERIIRLLQSIEEA